MTFDLHRTTWPNEKLLGKLVQVGFFGLPYSYFVETEDPTAAFKMICLSVGSFSKSPGKRRKQKNPADDLVN